MGQREVGVVTRRVTCTCWLLWLSVEMPWLALGGPILALFAQIGLENTALTLCRSPCDLLSISINDSTLASVCYTVIIWLGLG